MGTMDRTVLALSEVFLRQWLYEIFTETSQNVDNHYSTSEREGTTLRIWSGEDRVTSGRRA